MDPSTPVSDFSRLMQYGAVGVVAAGLLTLVVVLFRQFVTHALEQNKRLLDRHDEMQREHIKALHEQTASNSRLAQAFEGLRTDIGHLFNEVASLGAAEPRSFEATGRHRIRPPKGGSSSG